MLNEVFGLAFDKMSGHKGRIKPAYWWCNDSGVHSLEIGGDDWDMIPMKNHGKLLRGVHADLGAPKAIYILVETKALWKGSFGNSNEIDNVGFVMDFLYHIDFMKRNGSKNPEHKEYTLENTVDNLLMIGYDGNKFFTKIAELVVDENGKRNFSGKTVEMEKESSIGGFLINNLLEGFHNTWVMDNTNTIAQ